MPAIILPETYTEGFTPSYDVDLNNLQYPSFGKGLIGAWSPCLGFTGGKLIDYSGRKNHGVLTNMTLNTAWTTREGRHALFFDNGDPNGGGGSVGTQDYVSIPHHSLFIENQISVCVWARQTSSIRQTAGIIDKNRIVGWGLFFEQGSNKISWMVTNSEVLKSGYNLNQLYHIVGTYDGANMQLYIDGVLSASAAKTGAIGDTSIVEIGRLHDGYNLYGLVSDAMIYNRALSQQSVSTLFALGPGGWAAKKSKVFTIKVPEPLPDRSGGLIIPKSKPKLQTVLETGQSRFKYPELTRGLVGAWSPCLGFTGNKLIDYSGRKNDGILVNNPTWTNTDKKISLLFNGGILTYVQVDTNGATNTSYTYCVWARINTNGDNKYVLFENYASPGVYRSIGWNQGFWFTYHGSHGLASPGLVNKMQYVCMTVDQGIATMYVDGIQTAQATSIIPGVAGTSLRIGTYNGISSFSFSGYIAEVLKYERALSAYEIKINYNLGPGGWATTKDEFLPIGYPPTPIYDFRVIRAEHNKLFAPKNNMIY